MKEKFKKFTSSKYLLPALAVLFLASAGAAVYFYMQARSASADPTARADRETASLIAAVGRLIELPTGETPTIATVSEPEKLRDQPFFANAKAGDKVLLYQNARKVYLYDPSANKIVEVAPINLGSNNAASAAAAVTPTPAVTNPEPTPTVTTPAPSATAPATVSGPKPSKAAAPKTSAVKK